MSNKPEKNIFADADEKRLALNAESDKFIRCVPFLIKSVCDSIQGFTAYANASKYYIETDPENPGWLQISFGNRPLRRPDPTGKMALETGPSLVYTRGPDGRMLVVLYPVKSQVASVKEDSLIIRMGKFSYLGLIAGVRQDIRDLIAYAYVSSLDIQPTWSQKLRIGWLRLTCRQHIEGKHHYPPVIKYIGSALNGSLAGIFKGLAYAAVIWLIAKYGPELLTELLKK